MPLMRLQEAQAEVVVAGEAAGKSYFGKHGKCMEGKADVGFDEVNPQEFDGIIIPGG